MTRTAGMSEALAPAGRLVTDWRTATKLRERWTSTVLGGAVLVAASAAFGWMSVLLLRRGDGLATQAYDQAYFQQLVWNLSQGNGLRSDFNPGEFLGLHFSPLLVLPALLQPLWADARLLSLLHAGALAAAGPAAFLFLRAAFRPATLGPWLAAGLALSLPAWAIVQQAALADFHTEALALPLVFLVGWAGLTRRPAAMWLLAVLALLAKEDQIYPVAVMGLLVAARASGSIRRGMRRHGLLLVGLTVAWGIVAFGILMPRLRNGAVYDIDRYYAWLGGGLNVLAVPFQQPSALVAALTRPDGWLVVGALVLSLAATPMLAGRWLLLLLPPVMAHLLSRHEPQPEITLQYGLLLIVPALSSAAIGGRRLLAWGMLRRRRALDRATTRVLAPIRMGRAGPAVLLLAAALPGLVIGAQRAALPPFATELTRFWNRPAAIDRLRGFAASVPADAPLSVDWGLAPPLASRRHLHVFPVLEDGDFALVDRRPFITGRLKWRDREGWLAALPASGRRLLADDGRFQLWSPVGG